MRLDELFERISKENLEEAETVKEELDSSKFYWSTDVDSLYRYFHDSFKIFGRCKIIVDKCLSAILKLFDEDVNSRDNIIPKMKELDMDPRFIKEMEECLKMERHPGKMELEEWQKLNSASRDARISLDSCFRFIEELFEGKKPGNILDYYQALFFYLFVPDWRHRLEEEVLEFISSSDNVELKKVYKNEIEEWKKRKKNIINKVKNKALLNREEEEIYDRILYYAEEKDNGSINIDVDKISPFSNERTTLAMVNFYDEEEESDIFQNLKVVCEREIKDELLKYFKNTEFEKTDKYINSPLYEKTVNIKKETSLDNIIKEYYKKFKEILPNNKNYTINS